MCNCHVRPRRDPCSAANNHDIVVTHTSIKWDVHFQLRMLIGQATLECTMIRKTDKLMLDVRDLSIRSVTVNGKVVDFRIAPNSYTFFGSKMTIYLPNDAQGDGERFPFKAPYLFSQCQAIHARSIVPCMDTPSVKSTYEAQVTVPAGLTCLMSAIGEGSKGDDESTTFFFKQPVAIPSYLIAIVVGAVEKRDISERVAVWAEPSVVDKAHWEFSET
ncbi:unnamed protein product, partial [Nippostrongylus brasiliensis]|uniref:Leukotriene A-4 hydrolase (inferred by orthology to a human protein) n=1 Tax=Nippostrongylus brasiliensis TaxID=27835 RepID=A0A0N4XDS3_NIPBR